MGRTSLNIECTLLDQPPEAWQDEFARILSRGEDPREELFRLQHEVKILNHLLCIAISQTEDELVVVSDKEMQEIEAQGDSVEISSVEGNRILTRRRP